MGKPPTLAEQQLRALDRLRSIEANRDFYLAGVAGLRDLAAMKLAAIARRGTRRDFWDLYEICKGTDVTLRVALAAYRAKFGVSESDVYHVLRSLTYFADAEAEPLPAGLAPDGWLRIREYFEGLVATQPWKQT